MREFDARGLRCPMPIIKLRGFLKDVAPGEEVRVLADDRGFPPDIRAWCEKTGNALVSLDEHDPANLVAVVRRGPA